MAEHAHTPGPWEAVRRGLDPLDPISIRRAETSGRYVAAIWPEHSDDPVEVAANAQLIVAAPALLESLLAVEWAGNEDGTDGLDGYDCCPNCGAALGSLHTAGCELRDALDAALGVKSPRMEVARG